MIVDDVARVAGDDGHVKERIGLRVTWMQDPHELALTPGAGSASLTGVRGIALWIVTANRAGNGRRSAGCIAPVRYGVRSTGGHV